MPEPKSYHRPRFPAEIISYAVCLYDVLSLNLRDVELAERGVVVTHESIRAWCKKFGRRPWGTRDKPMPDALLAHTSPLSWEHTGFSGDFPWGRATTTAGRRRPRNLERNR